MNNKAKRLLVEKTFFLIVVRNLNKIKQIMLLEVDRINFVNVLKKKNILKLNSFANVCLQSVPARFPAHPQVSTNILYNATNICMHPSVANPLITSTFVYSGALTTKYISVSNTKTYILKLCLCPSRPCFIIILYSFAMFVLTLKVDRF